MPLFSSGKKTREGLEYLQNFGAAYETRTRSSDLEGQHATIEHQSRTLQLVDVVRFELTEPEATGLQPVETLQRPRTSIICRRAFYPALGVAEIIIHSTYINVFNLLTQALFFHFFETEEQSLFIPFGHCEFHTTPRLLFVVSFTTCKQST